MEQSWSLDSLLVWKGLFKTLTNIKLCIKLINRTEFDSVRCFANCHLIYLSSRPNESHLPRQVYEDVQMSAGRRPHHHHHHHQLESYENTDQFRHNLGNGIYPPPPPAAPLSDLRKTSGDPLRLQGRDSREEPETTNNKTSAEAFRHLLVGDQGEGASGDLLRRLEEAISRGDHK